MKSQSTDRGDGGCASTWLWHTWQRKQEGRWGKEEQEFLPNRVFAVLYPGPALVSPRKNWQRQRYSVLSPSAEFSLELAVSSVPFLLGHPGTPS